MIKSCELCVTIDWKPGEVCRVITCNMCPGAVLMLVVREHRLFTEFEKELIKRLWGDNYNIRFKMRQILDHGHCHFEEKTAAHL